jgi:hypothetical protein
MHKSLIKALILSSILFFSSYVGSKERVGTMSAAAPDGSMVVVLYPAPCKGKVLKLIPKEIQKEFQKAEVILKGKAPLQACWSGSFDPDKVTIIDEDGDSGFIGTSFFKPTTGM